MPIIPLTKMQDELLSGLNQMFDDTYFPPPEPRWRVFYTWRDDLLKPEVERIIPAESEPVMVWNKSVTYVRAPDELGAFKAFMERYKDDEATLPRRAAGREG